MTKQQENIQLLNRTRSENTLSDITRKTVARIITELPELQQPILITDDNCAFLVFEAELDNSILEIIIFDKNIEIWVEKYDREEGGWEYINGEIATGTTVFDIINIYYSGCNMNTLDSCICE